MELGPIRPRRLAAFGDDALDADLASILMDQDGPQSPVAWLHDWWHRPDVERIWQPPPSWRDDLKYYAVALVVLQLVLAVSLILRDGSLSDDFGTLASMAGI
jgi:hypothetical protein